MFVSRQRITGAVNGSSAYLLALARSIRDAGFAVHLVQPSPTIAGRTPVMKLSPDMAVFAEHHLRGTVRWGPWVVFVDPAIWWFAATGMAKRLLRAAGFTAAWTRDTPRPYAVATRWTGRDHAFVAKHTPAGAAAMIADYVFCGDAFEHVSDTRGKAIVMHDLFHAREGGGADSVAQLSRETEIAMLQRAHAVFAIQQEERDFVAREVPGTEAILVPMPALPVANPQVGKANRLLFVGSNTAPNVVGLRWFLDAVWPLLTKSDSDISLDIAGTVNRAFASEGSDPKVRFLGIVPDLEPLYRDAGVVISPLTFGSGLKIKLVEGLAQGKAMVVTTTTLQGVEDICGSATAVADDATLFATHIGRLLADSSARSDLAERALSCAIDHFSANAVHADMRRWLQRFT